MIEDTLLVVQPVSNGPSEKVGILAGDRIIAVNDSAIAGVKMSTEDIMSRLRGEKGSEVKLTIVRRGVNEPLFFTVKRDKIPILSLDAAYMIQPRTGYIRINRFGATTAEEFLKALKELQKKGMKDLILDLQGNGGGYLNAAIDLANEFLQQKDLIVYTEGRAARRSNFHAKGNGKFKDGRLVVWWMNIPHPPVNRNRSHSGLGQRCSRRSAHFRQRIGATPYRPAGRLYDTPDHCSLLYSFRPLHTEAL